MNEQNDIWEVLSTFQEALKLIENRLDAQDQAINACQDASKEVERVLFDDIINPAKSLMDEADYNDRFEDFSNTYGEKLGGYNDTLKKLEGDDGFDLTKKAFDDLEGREDHPDAETYVDALTQSIDEQLAMIRETLGVSPDAEVEVTQDGEDGTTQVKVDGEDKTAEVEAAEGNEDNIEGEEELSENEVEDKKPSKADAILTDIPTEEEEEPAEDDEDEDDFIKQAEKALSRAGKLPGRD